MDHYQIKAFAKINLGLDVIGKLENGYHEVKMIMQTVGLYDELELRKIPQGIELSIVDDVLPADESNLVYRAAKLMLETYLLPAGIAIRLRKNIPIAAGMAGGSTDAAAVLKAINRMFDLDCTLKELLLLGEKLGADVPYCVLGGTALAEGIGEKLSCLDPAPDCYVLIATPDIIVPTGYVYGELDKLGIAKHPDIDGMEEAIREESLQGVIDRLGNVLEDVTIRKYPVIAVLKEEMCRLGALGSLMSGSGPTVFGIFVNRTSAEEAFRVMKRNHPDTKVFLTTFN